MSSFNLNRDGLNLSQVHHTALLYHSDEEHKSMNRILWDHAQQNNLRIVYIQDNLRKTAAIHKFIPADNSRNNKARHAVCINPHRQSSGSKDSSDIDNIFQILNCEIAISQKNGFNGLYLSIESSALKPEWSIDDLIQYENELNRLTADKSCKVLCAYKQNQFSSQAILYVMRTHPHMILNGKLIRNPYYLPSKNFKKSHFFDRELQNWLHTLTEKNNVEDCLDAEKKKLLNTILKNPRSVSIYNAQGHFIKGNQAYKNLFGSVPPPEYSIFKDPILNHDPAHKKMLRKLKKGEALKATSAIWYNPEKIDPGLPAKEVLVEGFAIPILDENNKIERIIVFHEDITEKEKNKQALQQSLIQYKTIFKNVNEGILFTDQKGFILDVNPALCRMTGIPKKDVIGQSPFYIIKKYLKKQDIPRITKIVKSLINEVNKRDIAIFEIELKNKILEIKTPFVRKGSIYTVLVRDVTKQKKAEKTLQTDKTKLEGLVKSRTAELQVANTQLKNEIAEKNLAEKRTRLHFQNMKFLSETTESFLEKIHQEDIFEHIGNKLKKYVGNPIVIINHFDKNTKIFRIASIHGINKTLKKVIALCGEHPKEIQIRLAKGKKTTYTTHRLQRVDGGLYELSQHHFSKQVCESLEKLLRIEDIYTIGFMWRGDCFGTALIITRTNTTPHFDKDIVETFIHLSSIALQNHRTHAKLEESHFELETQVKQRTKELRKSNLELQEEVKKREQVEKQIRSSLKEKDELLLEIHHRVKNNLQIITSLIRLQLKYTRNEHAEMILRDCRNRIYSMALIHESFYNSRDFTRIDLAKYIQTLFSHLIETETRRKRKIKYHIKVAKFPIPLHQAIPCGLVLNEIVTNAMQFAFPPHWKGHPEIECICSTKNNKFKIRVRDNGIGIPAHIDIENPKSLGLELINILIKNQLNGKMHVNTKDGTEYNITLNLNN